MKKVLTSSVAPAVMFMKDASFDLKIIEIDRYYFEYVIASWIKL